MTITFQGHISEMKVGAEGMDLVIQTPTAECYGKLFILRIPADQAKYWIPGRMVSFTLYTLPEPESQGG